MRFRFAHRPALAALRRAAAAALAPSALAVLALALALALAIGGCATSGGPTPPRPAVDARNVRPEEGVASYYAHRFHGRRTASGERYDERELTAAHRTLPFGTRVRVTHLASRRSVVLRINDRGPHAKARVLDVSLAAARALEFVRDGVARVRVEVVGGEAAAR